MAIIPTGQKFHTVPSNVVTKERGSALINSLHEVYTMQDIIGTVSNPTSGYLPYNNGGVFADSKISQGLTVFNVNQAVPSIFAGYAPYLPYNIKFNQNYWSIGMDNGTVNIPNQLKWGISFDYSSFELFGGFGKSEGNGFYSKYNTRTTIGMNNSYFGVNASSQLTASGSILNYIPPGLPATTYYNFLFININGTDYRIPLYT
jgi:hypothetical protein